MRYFLWLGKTVVAVVSVVGVIFFSHSILDYFLNRDGDFPGRISRHSE